MKYTPIDKIKEGEEKPWYKTPAPWELKNGFMVAANGTVVVGIEQHLERIIECVNAHQALVESLSEIVEHLESIADAEGFKITDHAVYQRAKEALKAAGVEV